MTFPSLIGDIEDAEKRGTQQEKEAVAIRMLKNGESEEKTVLYSSLPLAMVQKLARAVSLGTL